MATPHSPGRTSLVASPSENTSLAHLPSKVSVWVKQTAVYTGLPPHHSWVDALLISSVAMVTLNTHSSSHEVHMWSYPVRSDEGVSLVTNELLANVNDLPEVVLIKIRMQAKTQTNKCNYRHL